MLDSECGMAVEQITKLQAFGLDLFSERQVLALREKKGKGREGEG